jgi:uroporphyrinogen decarboxylase
MKPFLQAIHNIPLDTPPLWLMRQAGRYLPEYRKIRQSVSGFLEMCYTPELAAEVTLQPIRRFGFDAAIIFSDILVVPDALGMKVAFKAGEGPVLDALVVEEDIAKLAVSNVVPHIAPMYEAIRVVKKELPAHTALIGFAGSPWTVATYMVEGGSSKDFIKTKKWAYRAPQSFDRLISILVEATVEHLSAQIEAGVEVVQLFDSWASVLPDRAFIEWVVEPNRMIVEKLKKKHPNIPVIGFPRGAGHYYEAYVKRTGVDVIGLDTAASPAWAAKHLQPLLPVQGNLDPIMLLTDPGTIEENVLHIMNSFKDGAFIVNLGHGILPETPVEHVECLVEAVRSWRKSH